MPDDHQVEDSNWTLPVAKRGRDELDLVLADCAVAGWQVHITTEQKRLLTSVSVIIRHEGMDYGTVRAIDPVWSEIGHGAMVVNTDRGTFRTGGVLKMPAMPDRRTVAGAIVRAVEGTCTYSFVKAHVRLPEPAWQWKPPIRCVEWERSDG